MNTNPIHPYGWRPQLPDHRDFKLSLPAISMPDHVDLSPTFPFVFDQKTLGSCTANAISLVVARLQNIQNPHWPFTPSRLFIYWNERDLEGTADQDSGAVIRDGLKVLAKLGVCTEARWPYSELSFRNKPTEDAYADALLHRAARYARADEARQAHEPADEANRTGHRGEMTKSPPA